VGEGGAESPAQENQEQEEDDDPLAMNLAMIDDIQKDRMENLIS